MVFGRIIIQELVTYSNVFANWVRAARIDGIGCEGVAATQTELFVINDTWKVLSTENSHCRFHRIQTHL